jgi:hypothetical protein
MNKQRGMLVVALLPLALSNAGAEDQLRTPPPIQKTLSDGPAPSYTPRVSRERQAPVQDPFEALNAPLSNDEERELRSLTERLGATSVATRDAAARDIKMRFGARAAGALLEIADRDLDVERRFRERSLVGSLVLAYFLDRSPHCGWLGIRWQGASTEKHYFSAHVVEAVQNEPAARGGLLSGDEIVCWNGDALENQMDFIDHVQAQAPGTVAELVVERGGREVRVRVTMGTRVDPTSHMPELPYPTFQRDMAQRQTARWLSAWRKRH